MSVTVKNLSQPGRTSRKFSLALWSRLSLIIDNGKGSRFEPRGDTNDPAAGDSQYDIPTLLRKQAD